ncbi:hypothetical protein AB0M29_40675 [Streptomyces sp. NPDC051976]|uniref:hypothetical protein n=1 Tax=Streptomyces sp. NPDC051976 TaxID=3154947 RepID=UPI003427FAA5
MGATEDGPPDAGGLDEDSSGETPLPPPEHPASSSAAAAATAAPLAARAEPARRVPARRPPAAPPPAYPLSGVTALTPLIRPAFPTSTPHPRTTPQAMARVTD